MTRKTKIYIQSMIPSPHPHPDPSPHAPLPTLQDHWPSHHLYSGSTTGTGPGPAPPPCPLNTLLNSQNTTSAPTTYIIRRYCRSALWLAMLREW